MAYFALRRMAPLVLLAVACSACDRSTEQAAQLPIVHPDLDQYEPGVAERLGAEIAAYAAAVATGEDSVVADAAGRLGMVYQAHHISAPALSAYALAASLSPGDFRWHYYQGVLLADSGDPGAALVAFADAAGLKPDDVPLLLRQGNALVDSGRAAEARTRFDRVLDLQPRSAAALAGLGRAAMLGGDAKTAAESFEAALAIQPGATRLHHPLGLARRALGDTQAAARHLGMRGNTDPAFVDPLMADVAALSHSAQFYLARGTSALDANNAEAAAADFRRAVMLNPDDVTARATLARTLQDLGRTGEALAELDAALAVDPAHTVANYFKGALHERLGDDARAIRYYEAALRGDPEYPEPRMLLANALMRTGRFDEAVVQYAWLEQTHTQSVRIHHWHGLALLAAGQCELAAVPLETAYRLKPDYGPVLIALARRDATCPGAGKAEINRAVELGQALYAARPDYETAATLAMALAAAGRFEEAVATQREALSLANAAKVPVGLTGIEADLQRYGQRKPARRAWQPGSPAFFPPPRQQ